MRLRHGITIVDTANETNDRLVARSAARELSLVLIAAVVYVGVRAVTEGRIETASANGEAILAIEETVGIAWEAAAQSLVLGHEAFVTAANWIYIWGHWPVIATVAIWLYAARPDRYLRLRDAVLVSGAIGFAFFAFLPVAPPRLMELDFVDTVVEYSGSYRALQPPAITNQYAALPSLHVGWNALVGIVLFVATTSWLVRAFAVAMPVAMTFAVVATANHYVLDVAVGVVVALLGLVAALALERERTPAARSAPRPASDLG